MAASLRLRASIVGRTISLDGSPHRIAGVLPDGFNFPGDVPDGMSSGVVPRVDLWMPATLRSDDRRNSFLHVFARLKPEVSIVQAGEEMSGERRARAAACRLRYEHRHPMQ